MTLNVSRRSLLALGAGLGASTLLGGTASARAPKLGTQTPYWHRFVLGDAEVTVFDGTGVGLQDLAVASAVVELAKQQGKAAKVDL